MTTPAEYREFVAECYRLASVAKTDEHRKMLQEMARAWAKVAEEDGSSARADSGGSVNAR